MNLNQTVLQKPKSVGFFYFNFFKRNVKTKNVCPIAYNTAGSGTTAIACLNTNRQFIVMEKEQEYYDIILNRVGDFNKKFETQTLFGNEM